MFIISSAPAAAWPAIGPVGLHGVFADGQPDPHPADTEQPGRTGSRGEVPLLVEYRIIGQQLLVVFPPDLTLGTEGGGVVKVQPLVHEADDRGALVGSGRHLGQGGQVVRDETGLEQQVLGRVAGYRQLGKHGEVRLRFLGHRNALDNALHIARQVADNRIDLAQGHCTRATP